jgi:hypothetical protein
MEEVEYGIWKRTLHFSQLKLNGLILTRAKLNFNYNYGI